MIVPIEQHIMFDIDGTVLQSCDFDGRCYDQAILEITGLRLHSDRRYYKHVSDEGILLQHFSELGLENVPSKIEQIKTRFVEKIRHHLSQSPATVVPGANQIITTLKQCKNVSISFATGGWEETARMKLESAGVNIGNLPFASSDDHFARCDIMQTAKKRARIGDDVPITYVGDGQWDLNASSELGWNFILIGDTIAHHQQMPNFLDIKQFQSYLF